MRIIAIFLLTTVLTGLAKSQSASTLMGARSAGMAYASAILQDDWSLLNNPAGMTKITQPAVMFAYESRPALPGCDRISAIGAIPMKEGVAGAGIYSFGDEVYSESMLVAGYGNTLGISSLGATLRMVQYRAEGFGTRHVWSLTFGGIAQITPEVSVGAYIVNLNQPRLSIVDEQRLPAKLHLGIGFKPIENLQLACEVEKDLEYKALVKSGVEYRVHQKVCVRTGFQVHPETAYCGIGFSLNALTVDYSLQYSSGLNCAHQASAAYRLANKKEKRGK